MQEVLSLIEDLKDIRLDFYRSGAQLDALITRLESELYKVGDLSDTVKLTIDNYVTLYKFDKECRGLSGLEEKENAKLKALKQKVEIH